MDNSTIYVDAKRGKIKWYNNNKGYGFITGDDGEEVFLHNSMINNHAHGEKIEEGDSVLYEIELGDKGLMAKHVLLEKNDSFVNNTHKANSTDNIISSSCNEEAEKEITLVKRILFQHRKQLNNPKIIRGLLADYVSDKALRYVLTNLYNEGIIDSFINANDLNIVKHKYYNMLISQYAINENYANVGVNTWCDILNDIKLNNN